MQKARFDQPLRKLRQAREELRREYSRIRHDLVRLDKMIAQLETMNETGGTSASFPNVVDALQDISARDIEGLSHAQAATLILSRTAAPMTIRQLLAVLERAGRKLSPKNGYGILHKSLRNHKQFDSVAGKWRLVAAPYGAPLHEARADHAVAG
jgi:chromosome segregation ATPase